MQKTKMQRVLFFLGISRENMSTKTLVRVAMLTAIAILLKSYGSLETGIWRLSFYEIPLVMLGTFFGPIPAFIGGLSTDFGYIMSRGWMYGINYFTITTVLWAFVPAMLLYKRKYTVTRLVIVVAFTSLLGFTFNTLGLVQFFGTTQLVVFSDGVVGPMLPRIVTALLKLPVQVYIVNVLVTRLHMAFEDLELVTE